MAEAKLNDLHNVTLTIEISKSLQWRLIAFKWLLRLACWVGSVGGIEFVQFDETTTNKMSVANRRALGLPLIEDSEV